MIFPEHSPNYPVLASLKTLQITANDNLPRHHMPISNRLWQQGIVLALSQYWLMTNQRRNLSWCESDGFSQMANRQNHLPRNSLYYMAV